MHPSKYHSPKPASRAAANNTGKGIAVPAPVQRVIEYGYSGRFKRHINDKDDLISACREYFPRFTLAYIAENVNIIDQQAKSWTLGDFYLHFTREHKKSPPLLVKEESKEEILLPPSKSDQANYAFTRRTRLMALIKQGKKKHLLPGFSQDTNKKKHAEDLLKAYLLEQGAHFNSKSGVLIITINNSPCLDKCSKMLIKFKQTKWKGKIIIHYANPHGAPEEFVKRRKEMQEVGIEMHSFNPLAHIDDLSILSEDQLEDFRAIGDRRKRARAIWNEKNPSDQSESSEEEGPGPAPASSSKKKNRKKKKKKKKARTASPEPAADAPEEGETSEDESQFSSSRRITRSSKAAPAVAAAAVTSFDPDDRKYSNWQQPREEKKKPSASSSSSSSSSSRRFTRSQARAAADSDGED